PRRLRTEHRQSDAELDRQRSDPRAALQRQAAERAFLPGRAPPAQVEGMSGQPDFHPSGPPISVQKGLPSPRQCSAAASMASSASVASCPCPPQKCLLFSRMTTQPLAESHDRSFSPPAKALQSALSLSGKRSARDTSSRKSSLSCAWPMST